MRHGFTLATVVALGIGASTLLAAERATFILTNGERVNGTVVFHTEEQTNIRADKNEFNLKVSDGTEMPIPFNQVAVIDFVGGQPRDEEYGAMEGTSHVLAMRDGDIRRGRLVDLVRGDTVRWQPEGGDRMEIPITQVRRIYLNINRAAALFDRNTWMNARRNTATPSAPVTTANRGVRGTRGIGVNPNGEDFVVVRGNVAWTDTGITLRVGDSFTLEPTGKVFFAKGEDTSTGPDGNPNFKNDQFPVPDLPAGALIGKVGPTGRPFAIGSAPEPIRVGQAGRLYLGINDTIMDDNSGSFRVVITSVVGNDRTNRR